NGDTGYWISTSYWMVSHGLTVSPAAISVTPSARKTRIPVVTKLPRHMGGSMCAHAAGPPASTSRPATPRLANTLRVIFIALSFWLFLFCLVFGLLRASYRTP